MTTIELHLSDDPPLLATLAIGFDSEQVDSMDAAERMTASELAVSANGIKLTLLHGLLRYMPDGWRDWWVSADLEPCVGMPALASFRLFTSRAKRRGEHGPPATGAALRRLLLSAALRRVADGASMRVAVADAIETHAPERGATAEAALLRRLTRHLLKG